MSAEAALIGGGTHPVLTLRERRPSIPTPPASPPASMLVPVAAPNTVLREKFWFNWSPTELCPKRRYATLESARAEAVRWRSIAPHKEFLTYEARLVTESEEQKANGNEAAAPAAAPAGD
jgi:hypothetical protein